MKYKLLPNLTTYNSRPPELVLVFSGVRVEHQLINTNTIKKTWPSYKTNGGKDKPNNIFMWTSPQNKKVN